MSWSPDFRTAAAAASRLAFPFAVALVVFYTRGSVFWLTTAWGLLMWLAMAGWGALAEYAVARTSKADLGLHGAWGMAVMLGLGGVANMLHLASRPFLLGLLAAGCLLATVARMHGRPPPLSKRRLLATLARPAPYVVLLVAAVMIGFEYLGQTASTWTNQSDDQPLYFFLPQKMVQTGTIFDPFDVRRMTTYGGQFFLHALFLSAVGKTYQLNLVDAGVGTILVVSLVVGAFARRGLRRANAGHLALVLLLVLTIEHVRFNIGSLMTGAAALLGAYRTLLWIDEKWSLGPIPVSPVLLLAGSACAACVLRTSNALPVSLFMGIALVQRAMSAPGPVRARARVAAMDLVAYGFACALILLPWLVSFRESAGTLVYPLSRGNMTPDFAILKIEDGIDYNLKHIVRDLGYEKPIVTSMVFLAAAFAPVALRRREERDYLTALSVVCLLGMLFISYMGGAFDETANARYYFAFLVWTVLAVAISVGRGGVRAIIVVAAIAVHVAFAREEAKKRLVAHIDAVERATTSALEELQADSFLTQDYQDVQYHVPEGEKIAAAVYDPFRFNMKRNDVYSLDLVGGMGPKPGFPVFQGPDALARYLVANGVKYLVHVDFHKPHDLYDLDRWRRHKTLTHSFLAYEAPFMVDGMESIEKLDAMRRVVYKQFGLTLIDLTAPPEVSPVLESPTP